MEASAPVSREDWRRILWVASLLVALGGSTVLLIRMGVEWGAGAAP
jgi:hypothetical protein